MVDIYRAAKGEAILFFFVCSEVNSTWLITSELANQRARKALFACVVYTKSHYSKRNHTSLSSGSPILFKLKFGDVDFCGRRKSRDSGEQLLEGGFTRLELNQGELSHHCSFIYPTLH